MHYTHTMVTRNILVVNTSCGLRVLTRRHSTAEWIMFRIARVSAMLSRFTNCRFPEYVPEAARIGQDIDNWTVLARIRN